MSDLVIGKPVLEEEMLEACDKLFEAAREFRKVRNAASSNDSPCVWVEHEDGGLVVYTRGEYGEKILKAVKEIVKGAFLDEVIP